jgi:hypothetical protein
MQMTVSNAKSCVFLYKFRKFSAGTAAETLFLASRPEKRQDFGLSVFNLVVSSR